MRIGFALLVGCGPVDIPDEAVGWESCAPLMAPLQEQAVVVLGDEVVVVGGIDSETLSSTRVEAYDPAADSWRSLPNLPQGRHHVNAAVVDGAVYVLGGLNAGFTAMPESWVLLDGAWAPIAQMPPGRQRGAATVGVVEGRIHVVGGVAVVDVPWHDVYDPSTNSWTTLVDAPISRDHAGGTVIDGTFYVVGGRHRSIADHVGDLMGWTSTGWRAHAPMPTSRGGFAVTALAGRMHVIGGEGAPGEASGVFDVHEAWDPTEDAWTSLTPPTVPRHGTGAGVVGDILVLPGGADVQAFGAVDTCERFSVEAL